MPLIATLRGVTVSHFDRADDSPFSTNLLFEVECEGFPSVDAKTNESEAGWLLSRQRYEAQEVLPLLLEPEVDEIDEFVSYGFNDAPDGNLWLYSSRVYFTKDLELTAEDIRALVNVERNKRRLVLEKAHALQAMSDNYERPKRRDTIPQLIRVEVWQRDGGRCIECGSQERLEFDHVIPLAMGGSNTARNLQLLCETCNRRKGASLG